MQGGNIANNIYQDILEISDIERQKDYWLGRNPKHISSYVEVMCRLFDDNVFESFIDNVESKKASGKIALELKKLRDSLNSYKEKETDKEIIEDPEWAKVVNQAKIVIEIWNTQE